MRKERHNKNKKQNNYGSDYECKNYEKRSNGTEYCHDECDFIIGIHDDYSGKLLCLGNRHNCFKMKQKYLASLSVAGRNKQINN